MDLVRYAGCVCRRTTC
ncbi:hypothetical protein ACJ6WF_30640 [Streptomyces sp. MMS24-I2-30]